MKKYLPLLTLAVLTGCKFGNLEKSGKTADASPTPEASSSPPSASPTPEPGLSIRASNLVIKDGSSVAGYVVAPIVFGGALILSPQGALHVVNPWNGTFTPMPTHVWFETTDCSGNAYVKGNDVPMFPGLEFEIATHGKWYRATSRETGTLTFRSAYFYEQAAGTCSNGFSPETWPKPFKVMEITAPTKDYSSLAPLTINPE